MRPLSRLGTYSSVTALAIGMLVLCTNSALSLEAQHWQQLPDSAKRYYVLGSVEAWNEALRFTSDVGEAGLDDMLNTVMPCIAREKLNVNDLVSMLQRYLAENHREWQMEMSAVVFTVISQGCRKPES